MTQEVVGLEATPTKKASEGSGIVWCHDHGDRCAVAAIRPQQPRFLLARADRSSPEFDDALDELSVGMNLVAEDAQIRGQRERNRDDIQVGLLRTGSGFLPVWKREVQDDERLGDLVDVDSLTDLDSMSDDDLGSFLRVDAAGGTWKAYSKDEHGVYTCSGAGMGCFVTALDSLPEAELAAADPRRSSGYFATVDQDSPVFDATLQELAGTLNRLLSNIEEREKKDSTKHAGQRVGLAITESGVLPVWKVLGVDANS